MRLVINQKDIKKLKNFFINSPKNFQRTTANILTSLAFKTRENDIKNLHRGLTIRNERFLRSSLRVQKAKSTKIDRQIAIAYSIERPRFSGWKEQEYGTKRRNKRVPTTSARGGNKKRQVQGKYRFKSGNKFYRPEQFQGRTYKQQIMFMMRVLNSRGGGRFLLSTPYGRMRRGLYELKNHKISFLQKMQFNKRTKRWPWRTMSIRQLKQRDIDKIYRNSLRYIISKYR